MIFCNIRLQLGIKLNILKLLYRFCVINFKQIYNKDCYIEDFYCILNLGYEERK